MEMIPRLTDLHKVSSRTLKSRRVGKILRLTHLRKVSSRTLKSRRVGKIPRLMHLRKVQNYSNNNQKKKTTTKNTHTHKKKKTPTTKNNNNCGFLFRRKSEYNPLVELKPTVWERLHSSRIFMKYKTTLAGVSLS